MLYMTTIESMSSILAYCSPNLKETYGTWNVKIIATSFHSKTIKNKRESYSRQALGST